jgi:hypothetical protein
VIATRESRDRHRPPTREFRDRRHAVGSKEIEVGASRHDAYLGELDADDV